MYNNILIQYSYCTVVRSTDCTSTVLRITVDCSQPGTVYCRSNFAEQLSISIRHDSLLYGTTVYSQIIIVDVDMS